MWETLPEFGTGVLYAVLVAAAYTFALSVAAGRGRPRLLQSARLGAYATAALVLLGVLLLAYAFVTHDFRIRYVSRYSNRSTEWWYLLTALWGGQDGSLLWWSLLLSGYTASCVWWLKGRYRHLQPYVIATLMVIIAFFAVLMLFAANPFETNLAGPRMDGDGLNVSLRNFYMIIHPPSLYIGFVGCSIPFAFAVAALITGRLDNEWIVAVRKWMLFAWLFLTIGNALGMAWAYEELGWGGYWAWDPVENASFLPWFSATAFMHSVMLQERRDLAKLWNAFLVIFTFVLSLVGTYLTRSGIVSSVLAFASGDVGYWFLGFILVVSLGGLLLWAFRIFDFRSKEKIESVASREAVFVINNMILIAIPLGILFMTLYPKITATFGSGAKTLGITYYNTVMNPFFVAMLGLTALGPMFGWVRSSKKRVLRNALVPALASIPVACGIQGLSVLIKSGHGAPLSFFEHLYPTFMINYAGAFILTSLCYELGRTVLFRVQRRSQSWGDALNHLAFQHHRRLGGYVCHMGLAILSIGVVNSSMFKSKEEIILRHGERTAVGPYEVEFKEKSVEPNSVEESLPYTATRIQLEVFRNDKRVGRLVPERRDYPVTQYRPQPTGTTEPKILSLMQGFLHEDLYVFFRETHVPGDVRFEFYRNPLISLIWIGWIIMLSGAAWAAVPLGGRRVGLSD